MSVYNRKKHSSIYSVKRGFSNSNDILQLIVDIYFFSDVIKNIDLHPT